MIELDGYRLVLASQSPRRKELLSGLGLSFESRVKPIDESFPPQLPANEVASFLARKKAEAFQGEIGESEIVLTSDTVVILDGEILGKPANAEEAKAMLLRLSGMEHVVVTGICLTSQSRQVVQSDSTLVKFRPLNDREIDFYKETFRPFDKAGAYGIQEWIGFIGVEKIEGSFFTVMGLPLHLVYGILKDWNRK